MSPKRGPDATDSRRDGENSMAARQRNPSGGSQIDCQSAVVVALRRWLTTSWPKCGAPIQEVT